MKYLLLLNLIAIPRKKLFEFYSLELLYISLMLPDIVGFLFMCLLWNIRFNLFKTINQYVLQFIIQFS